MPFRKAGAPLLIPQVGQLNADDNLARGLVGWWPLNEGGGGRAFDESGRAQHGVLTNVPTAARGKFGPALQFNGSNQLVSVTLAKQLSNASWSATAWIYPTSLAGRFGVIWFDTGNLGGLEVGNGNGTAGLYLDSGGFWASSANNAIVANAWNFVGVSVSGLGPSNLQLYVNGLANGTVGASTAVAANFSSLVIGSRFGGSEPFAGRISDVRLYNRPLQPAEHRAIMAEPWRPFAPSRRRIISTPPAAAVVLTKRPRGRRARVIAQRRPTRLRYRATFPLTFLAALRRPHAAAVRLARRRRVAGRRIGTAVLTFLAALRPRHLGPRRALRPAARAARRRNIAALWLAWAWFGIRRPRATPARPPRRHRAARRTATAVLTFLAALRRHASSRVARRPRRLARRRPALTMTFPPAFLVALWRKRPVTIRHPHARVRQRPRVATALLWFLVALTRQPRHRPAPKPRRRIAWRRAAAIVIDAGRRLLNPRTVKARPDTSPGKPVKVERVVRPRSND